MPSDHYNPAVPDPSTIRAAQLHQAQWLAGVGHASAHSWELIFPAVAVPMSLDLGVEFHHLLPISFASYLLFGLGAVPAGWLTDRLGGRAVLLACLLLGGSGGLMVALAPSKELIAAALGMLGLAASLYHPAGLALLSRNFEKKGRAFALNGIAGNIGIAATPLLAGLIASVWGWRWAYVLLCLPGLLAGMYFALRPGLDDRDHHTGGGPTNEGELGGRLPLKAIAAFALALMAGGLAYRLHTLVVPALLQERIAGLGTWVEQLGLGGLDTPANLAATALTSAAYAMGIAGQWWGGRIADRSPLAPAYLLFHAAAMVLVGLASSLFGLPLVVALFAYIFFAIGMQPIENSLVAELTPPHLRGMAYAGKFLLGFGVGSTGVFVVGLVAPLGGLGASLFTAACLEVVVIAAAALLWRQSRRRSTAQERGGPTPRGPGPTAGSAR
jgi:MFS family permease